ncbi:MAG: hypothetical protein A2289_20745 [Deltaproteobacteria bacterium RIFOXYA12_FULL_58_15]|nr:MAG: hypothetical protein A2289_20745 [Deltaproteobacteria bacterium RIFOXYA12_FULL_58_15]OGR12789.1 MAG: hypothetical protein A2341_11080 [Deltaproteobacteria bacterium RIFOXYB12_FULL_58_9]
MHLENVTDDDLQRLRGVRRITGDFLLMGSQTVTDLNSLRALEEVGGSLYVERFEHLADLSGLDRLKRVGNGIVRFNPRLQSLNGLESLIRAGRQSDLNRHHRVVAIARGRPGQHGRRIPRGVRSRCTTGSRLGPTSCAYSHPNKRPNDAGLRRPVPACVDARTPQIALPADLQIKN